jgi:hypothetical protein
MFLRSAGYTLLFVKNVNSFLPLFNVQVVLFNRIVFMKRKERARLRKEFEMKTYSNIVRTLMLVLTLGLIGGAVSAFAQSGMPPMDNLAQLKNALKTAGVSALTSAQESSIQALITAFRDAHKPSPNTAGQDARAAYENAILNGDNATADAQAAILANAQTADRAQRDKDAAAFAINVIAILKTNAGQVEGLVSNMGASRFVKLALGLAGGGPGGFGPRGGGPGLGGDGLRGFGRNATARGGARPASAM